MPATRALLAALFVMTSFIVGQPRTARAQAPHDTVEAVVAAVTKAREDHAHGRTTIEFLPSLGASPARDSAVAHVLDAKIGGPGSSRRCTGSTPSSCHLVDADLVVAVTGLELSGDSGHVELKMYDETPSVRQPIHMTELVVLLARDGGAWRVTAVKYIAES